MSPIPPARKVIEDNPGDEEAPEHEWAEFNLPPALLRGLSRGDDDTLAFLCLTPDLDAQLPDGSSS